MRERLSWWSFPHIAPTYVHTWHIPYKCDDKYELCSYLNAIDVVFR